MRFSSPPATETDATALAALASHESDTTAVHGITDTADLLHTAGDETKSDTLTVSGVLSIVGQAQMSGLAVDAGAEETLTLAANVSSTSTTTWTVDQDSIDILAAKDLPVTARMAGGEQIVIREVDDGANTIKVVRRKFGTTASTYTSGATFVTDMTSNYVVGATGNSMISVVSYSGPNLYLPPVSAVEFNIDPPSDGTLFLVVDAAGGAFSVRSYYSGVTTEVGNHIADVDKLWGAILVRYDAATETYTVLAQNVLAQRLNLDTGAYEGFSEYAASGDPNGVHPGNIGDRYTNTDGGTGATFFVNTDGATAWDAL